MPYDDPDPEDPAVLIGVELPVDEDTDVEMAYVFAEEFARLGFSEKRLLDLFREPYYAGAYRALGTLGEEKVRGIVRETVGVWGQFRQVIEDAPETRPQWDVGLDSLQPGGAVGPGKGKP
jgi:hypothetical protein